MVTTDAQKAAASGEAQAPAPVSPHGPAPPLPPAPSAGATRRGAWPDWVSLARYLGQTEVHTYAFSVAANAILSLFPFIVMMFTVARGVFHSTAMVNSISGMLHDLLPSNQDFVVRNMALLVHPRGSVQAASVIMLLISSTGVFLPLEVALNRVWAVGKNRSYVMNQLVSLGLALVIGLLTMLTVVIATAQTGILTAVFFGHTENVVFGFFNHLFLQIAVAFLGVGMFLAIYWILPNRRLPLRAVLPTAIVMGLLWDCGRLVYILALPHLDLHSVYGPFEVSVSLMIWAFLTGLLLLAGAQYSATRHAVRLASAADREKSREQPIEIAAAKLS
ncbi:MAG TPA: YihY/virulence factor BrkB family protein [Acidobacteriaceae bacterium]|jgi:YihY family inner membrane protein|nr:YihY/virulence factor BrkB family protein [Acidobacteriaceae bacterium]